ncbi:MAG TPA: hypothetical protein VFU88_03140, partial [Ktedonobacterales bacterium]|nr:hypothetical protein [Ktedonobacterales bacterium]
MSPVSPSESPAPEGEPSLLPRRDPGPLVLRGKARARRRRIALISTLIAIVVLIAGGIPFVNTHVLVFHQVGIGPLHLFPVGAVSPLPLTEYRLSTPFASPSDIIRGPDGALYFIEDGQGKIGRIAPGGTITEMALPAGANASGIAFGSDGALWFTDSSANTVGRLTLQGQATEYALPVIDSQPSSITLGSDGALWFTEIVNIGRITTDGHISEFRMSEGSGPTAITTGRDGNLWFTDFARGTINRLTPTGQFTAFALPKGAQAGSITVGPDGALWYLDVRQNQIGRMTTTGQANEYSIPTNRVTLTGITTGPDGALWFTEFYAGTVGRITLDGDVSEYALPVFA